MEKKPHPIDTQLAGRLELQLGLPSPEDLTPLDQSLITPELATAFGIMPIMPTTCSTKFPGEPGEPLKLFPGKGESEGGKVRRRADENSGEGGGGSDDCYSGGDESGSSNRAVKRPRLVWTPKLHKRFVEVIDQLGVDKAVPKTIMEVMNVEGLTRENVASHLQKYRMYLKKADGNSTEMNLNLNLNSNSSPISVSSTSTGGRASPSSAFESGNGGFKPIPPLPSGMHFNPMTMMPLPLPAMVVGPASSFGYGGGQLGVGAPGKAGFCGIESGGFNASLLWNRHGG